MKELTFINNDCDQVIFVVGIEIVRPSISTYFVLCNTVSGNDFLQQLKRGIDILLNIS